MKNKKFICAVLVLIVALLAYLLSNLNTNDPKNCKNIVEINLEEIKDSLESGNKSEIETERYNLFDDGYSIDANFMIKKVEDVEEDAYAISQIVGLEITGATDKFIQYVVYCTEFEELWIILSSVKGPDSFKLVPTLLLDRIITEVVVFEVAGQLSEQLLDSYCSGAVWDNKPLEKRGSIIIGSK